MALIKSAQASLLLWLLALWLPVLLSGADQQELDDATCQLLCVNCEQSRLMYGRHCAASNSSAISGTARRCPCLQGEDGEVSSARAATNNSRPLGPEGCPEPQPPPPPPGCPPGGFVSCELGGPDGRCYGNCTCLTTTTTTRDDDASSCPPDRCPASNCRAYAQDGCRLCVDCAVNPWWCFSEPSANCGNATEVCGGGDFARDRDGCQVDCSCAVAEPAAPPATTTGTTTSCRLPGWLSSSCRRYCRRRYGGAGRLQVDGQGCERCRCCVPCGHSEIPRHYRHGGAYCQVEGEVNPDTGCPSCGMCE